MKYGKEGKSNWTGAAMEGGVGIFCEGQELRVAKAAACHADGIEKGEKN